MSIFNGQKYYDEPIVTNIEFPTACESRIDLTKTSIIGMSKRYDLGEFELKFYHLQESTGCSYHQIVFGVINDWICKHDVFMKAVKLISISFPSKGIGYCSFQAYTNGVVK